MRTSTSFLAFVVLALQTGALVSTASAAASTSPSSALSSSISSTSTPWSNGTYYTTSVVDVFITFCPVATTIVANGHTYTADALTTLTITDCPCTLTAAVGGIVPLASTAPVETDITAEANSFWMSEATATSTGKGSSSATAASGSMSISNSALQTAAAAAAFRPAAGVFALAGVVAFF